MSTVQDRLHALGYVIPEPLRLPPGVTLPFPWVRVVGNRALISGHGPTNADGSLAEPLGKVGSQVTQEQAFVAARLTGWPSWAASSASSEAWSASPVGRECSAW